MSCAWSTKYCNDCALAPNTLGNTNEPIEWAFNKFKSNFKLIVKLINICLQQLYMFSYPCWFCKVKLSVPWFGFTVIPQKCYNPQLRTLWLGPKIKSMAPNKFPLSVSAMAEWCSAQASNNRGTRTAPSNSENSERTCKWTNVAFYRLNITSLPHSIHGDQQPHLTNENLI